MLCCDSKFIVKFYLQGKKKKVHGQQSQLKQFRYSFIIFKKFINHINLYFIVI